MRGRPWWTYVGAGLMLMTLAVACGGSHSSSSGGQSSAGKGGISINGQQVSVAISSFQNLSGSYTCNPVAPNCAELMLTVTNHGNSAVTLPGPLVVAAVGQDGTVLSPQRNSVLSCDAQDSQNNVLPGNYQNLCYGFTLPSATYVVSSIQVSATAPAGSGSVTLPVTSAVTAPTTTIPTLTPYGTPPCTAAALNQALATAG